MKNTKHIFFLLTLIAFASCKKVIHVDLNSSAPRYVIEGNVDDGHGPYVVRITKSVNFDATNTFPGVSGALVVITDKTKNISDTLTEINKTDSLGYYHTHDASYLRGHEGDVYYLYVAVDNHVFTATSTMYPTVNIDSMYIQSSAFSGDMQVVPVYQDPAGVRNYYRFIEYIDNVPSPAIFIRNDYLTDGQLISRPLGRNDTVLKSGVTVTVNLQSIDSGVYEYFRTLSETIDQNSATPANPISNISGGALGYFSAYSVSGNSLLVK